MLGGADGRVVVDGEDRHGAEAAVVDDVRLPRQRAVAVDARVDAGAEVVRVRE